MNNIASREMSVIISISLALCVACMALSHWLTPKNCNLFDNSQRFYQCDNMNERLEDCNACVDDRMVLVAQSIFFLGFGFLLLPVFVSVLRNLQTRSIKQPKLFD
jgi:hypothetical protein